MHENFGDLREWIIAACVLVATFAVSQAARAALRKLGARSNWYVASELAPSFANLLYVVGLRLFADVAPLNGKLDAWLDSGIYVFAVLIVLGLLRRAALLGIEWSAARSAQSRTLQQGFIPLMRNVITLFVFFMGAIMILKRFNYDVMSLLTALGVGSLAVGLAAKETLSNMISGFTLIIDRNLRPGDRINLGGSVGDVEEIGLRSTKIRIGDGNTLIVPNAEMVNTRILNLSMPSREVTCGSTLRVPYSIPFNRVKAVCLSALEQVEKAQQNRGRWVNLASLSEGCQVITVGFWLKDMDHAGDALTDLHERLLARFREEGIPLLGPILSGSPENRS